MHTISQGKCIRNWFSAQITVMTKNLDFPELNCYNLSTVPYY